MSQLQEASIIAVGVLGTLIGIGAAAAAMPVVVYYLVMWNRYWGFQ